MNYLFNRLNTYRDNSLRKDFYEFSLKLIYFIRNSLAYCRGILASLSGKIKYEGLCRPLIIGASTQLLIRPGSSIVLKNSDEEISGDVFHNNPVFINATTIGMRPHYLALDPPAHKSTRIELLGNANLILEQNSMILSGGYISASNGSNITIGKNSYISQEVIINSRKGIKIGKNVLVGYQVMMMDYDAHTIVNKEDTNINSSRENKILIGDNVWIGARVTILKGVRIGSGSIIGANACVVSDIPENSLAVGNPAKVVRTNITWQR